MDTKELLLRAAGLLVDYIDSTVYPNTYAEACDVARSLRSMAACPTTDTRAPDMQEGTPLLAALLEAAAELAETWGGSPPSPAGRRAALAAAISNIKIP